MLIGPGLIIKRYLSCLARHTINVLYPTISIASRSARILRFSFKRRKYGLFFAISYLLIWVLIIIGEVSSYEFNNSATDYYESPTGIHTSIREVAEFDIGINLTNIWDLDLSSKTFNAEGYIWMKWDDLPSWLEEWDPEVLKKPIKSIGFVNAVERYDFIEESEPSVPWVDSDGKNIQWLFFSGKFIARDLDLKKFPFENILLPVEIEFDDFFSTEAKFTYKSSGETVAQNKSLHGYKFLGSKVLVRNHVYPTDWGQSEAKEHFGLDTTKYTNLRVDLSYNRSFRSSFLSIFLPLVIVMLVVVLTPLIELENIDAKIALPASVLLVLVFLQDSYKKMIPLGLEYPTYADYLYAICLSVTSMVFIWSVANSNLYLRSIGGSRQLVAKRRSRSELYFFWITFSYLLLSPLYLWIVLIR